LVEVAGTRIVERTEQRKRPRFKGPISLVMHVVMVVMMMVVMHHAGTGGSNDRQSEEGSENIGE
jgi:hypothetical protein